MPESRKVLRTAKPPPPPAYLRGTIETAGWAAIVEHCLEQMAQQSRIEHQWQLPEVARVAAGAKADALRELLDWVYKGADMDEMNPFARHNAALLHLVRLQTGVLLEVPEAKESAEDAPKVVRPGRRAGWTV